MRPGSHQVFALAQSPRIQTPRKSSMGNTKIQLPQPKIRCGSPTEKNRWNRVMRNVPVSGSAVSQQTASRCLGYRCLPASKVPGCFRFLTGHCLVCMSHGTSRPWGRSSGEAFVLSICPAFGFIFTCQAFFSVQMSYKGHPSDAEDLTDDRQQPIVASMCFRPLLMVQNTLIISPT